MTILIVDDNEVNLYQLQVLLRGNGYQVVTAVNGAEALATARQNPPDLIISDILMPVMDGFALCHEWKEDERLRQIPFVFYTATYTDERDREFALSLGAQRFLVKPEEPEVFMRTIREVAKQFERPPAPPAPPAANVPARLPVEEPPKEESGYLKQYNEVLVRKLEAKMEQLEQANRELERDITARKRVEEELGRANRALRTISQCNQALVRGTEEPHLLEDVCRILVHEGGYRMAWVGFAEHDEGKSVRPMAHAGFEEGYLQAAGITWADTERGRGPTGTAIRTKEPVVARSIQTEPSLAPWREEQLKRGYASSIALPIILNDNVVGALTINAVEVDAFDSAEIQLLTELSMDLAYGVQALRTRAEHKRAEEARAYLAAIVESSDDGIISKSPEGVIQSWNAGAERLYGYTAAEVIGQSIFLLVPPDRREEVTGFLNRIKQGVGIEHFETVRVTKDGRRIDVSVTISPLRNASGEVVGASMISRDISARKRAEEELRQSDERYKNFISHSNEGVWRVELEQPIPIDLPAEEGFERFLRYGYLAECNLAHAHNYGCSRPEELVGTRIRDLVSPSDRERLESFRSAIQGGWQTRTAEFRGLDKAGNPKNFLRTEIPIVENGMVVHIWGITRDITELKRAEEALRESEQKYRSLVSNLPDVVWTLNAENRFTFIGKNIEKLSGFSVDEVYQEGMNPYLASLHPDDVPKVAEGIRALFGEGRPFDVEVRAKRKGGGEWRWIHDRALATYEKNGMRYADGLLSDITERKRAEAEHIRLVTAIEQSAEGVVITNPTGDIEYVNPAFTRITGYRRDEVMGKNPRILKSGKHDLAFYQQLWATILSGQNWRGEVVNRRKDGSLYTEQMNITPIRDEGGRVTHFVATKQDVTEHKTLEEHVRQSAKMEAIGRLAGGVAHDFNNLLTIINGYSELLLEQVGADAQASNYLNEIKNAGVRAVSLTRQLLAFSRRQVLAPQVLDLNMVVSNLEKMLRRLIGEDVKLRTVLDPLIWRVKADPGQIEQVIMNLAVNARDAMPRGGNLTIETGNVELDEDFARNYATVKAGPHVMLAVSDTGVGMTPETQAHIFEPFFTTKEAGKGTGLGLATVYGIVKQSGGSIWAYSELGRGSAFKVYLPMVNESLAADTVNEEGDETSGTETILLVEDQKGVRSLIRLALESVGYEVLDAESPEIALSTCTSHSGPIHLLLTDVVMPGLSGPLVAEKVIALRPDIKVVYMSGYTDEAVVHHGMLGHDAPFIQKPFTPAALRKKIREALGRK